MSRPAITPEDWLEDHGLPPYKENGRVFVHNRTHATEFVEVTRLGETAALCLQYQPWGFTREMLEAMKAYADVAEAAIGDDEYAVARYSDAFRGAVANVEALLPPEQP